MARLDGLSLGRVTTREPTLEDAYVALVTDHGPRISRETAPPHDDARLEAALQAGVAQPVLPLDRRLHAVIYATMAYFLFQGGQQPATSSRPRWVGHDGHLVADDDRGARRCSGSGARDPRAPRRLADAVLGDLPADHARDRRIGIYSLGNGLLYVRVLFGVPVSVGLARVHRRGPPTIFAIGMLGFLMGSPSSASAQPGWSGTCSSSPSGRSVGS
jgi:hypothetical protein